jgi:sterol desaturase/sphingolipid hydroxylase (fatty acid hydroxylase superfamily)
MFTELFTSFLSIITTILASAATTSIIFHWNRYPIFNPEGDNWKTVLYTGRNVPLLLLEATITGYYLQKYYIVDTVHSPFVFVTHCILFSLGTEVIYYIYHRLAHMPVFYKWLHRKHHEKREVYPIDTFYLDPIDSTFLILSMALPVIMLHLNWYEYITVLYIYITMGFMSHSELFYDHHSLHHIYRTCNYCFLVPIMDMLCGTYR